MKIAVIGAGNIGRTLGGKWAAAGHEVAYASRTPAPPATVGMNDAVAGADVVLLSVPGGAAKEVLAGLGSALAGKVVIDATNDVQGGGTLHALDELPAGAHPVRAFNTLGWESFAEPVVAGMQADLFYAAEDGRAAEVAEQLIGDVGLAPVRVGGLDTAEIVDGLTRLWFTLVFQRRLGRRLALKLLVER